jgi:ribosomal protein S18 acetylase RimI-like enzyme
VSKKRLPRGRRKTADEAPSIVEVVATRPLTAGRFADLEQLFSEKGCSFARGCWCMAYRGERKMPDATHAEFVRSRKAQLRGLAKKRPPPGLIGYNASGQPIGWVAVGPRTSFTKLQRSKVMGPVDDQPVWSIVCFVVPSPFRGRGVASALLRYATNYSREHGAMIVEAYPIDRPGWSEDQWLWHGAMAMFTRAGFKEVARRKPFRPVMRLEFGRKRIAK